MASTEMIVRSDIESHSDYMLRMARIRSMRRLLETLEQEAEAIKRIELPLWYLEIQKSYIPYRGGWVDIGNGFILVREDVDQENLDYFRSKCRGHGGYDFTRKVRVENSCFVEDGPYIMITIGNDVTPHKRYYLGKLEYHHNSILPQLKQRLGSFTWESRPKDVDNVLKNHI